MFGYLTACCQASEALHRAGRQETSQALSRIVEKPECDTKCSSPIQAARKKMLPAGDVRPVLSSPDFWGTK